MLKTMQVQPFLRGTLAKKGAVGNIIVHTIDIGIGMVNDIVFELPDEGVAAQCIERKPHQVIDPAARGIAAMTGVVHDVEPGAGQNQAQ